MNNPELEALVKATGAVLKPWVKKVDSIDSKVKNTEQDLAEILSLLAELEKRVAQLEQKP
jgi:hypothetical protein